MKRHLLILCILLGLVGTRASAYDFEVNGIYYNIVSVTEFTCEVTSGDVKYSGDIEIPATVSYNNRTVSVTRIGQKAFYECTLLTSITIPNTVKIIDSQAFLGCSNLKTVINYSDLNILKDSSSDGYVGFYADKVINADEQVGDFYFRTDNGVCYLSGYIGTDSKISLPANYKGGSYEIGKRAFHNYLNLTKVIIPVSVTGIGDEAFLDCSNLKYLQIEDGKDTLKVGWNPKDYEWWNEKDGGIFSNCPLEYVHLGRNIAPSPSNTHQFSPFRGNSTLSTVTIGNGVTNIGLGAFYACTNLTQIIISNSVTSIDAVAFQECSNIESIDIPNSVTSIGYIAFAYCSNLKHINLSMGLDSIKPETFGNCHSLISIDIPNSVKDIGYGAFYGCTELRSINIPNSVTSIDEGAFYDCENLSSIILEPTTPPVAPKAFEESRYLSTTIYVPEEALAAYQSADGWKHFWNIKTEVVEATAITLDKSTATLCVGESTTLTATLSPADAINRTIWNSSNPNVATVKNGVITTHSWGSAIITATTGNLSATCTVTVNNPITDGEHYLYNPDQKLFLSRGEYWGTCATVDKYGIPFVWNTQESTIKFLDNELYLFEIEDKAIYTDGATHTRFQFVQLETGGYCLTSLKSLNYLKLAPGTHGQQIVTTTPNLNEATAWQLISKAEHDAIVAKYRTENYKHVIAEAESNFTSDKFVEFLSACKATDMTSYIGTARFAGNVGNWTYNEVRAQEWQPAYGTDFCELWQATGSYTQTITGLPKGIYKVTMQGFERNGGYVQCNALGEKGYKITTAYLKANNEQVNLKSWYSEKFGTDYPNNTTDAVDRFSDGCYMNELYTYVGNDGNLTLTVNKPSHVGDNWLLFNNFTLTHYEEVKATGITLDIDSKSMYEGDILTLTATVSPDNATNKDVTWISSNEAVATVKDGVVIAISAGRTVISAKIGEHKATCSIKVKSKIIEVTNISLDKLSAQLTEGETVILTATVSPDNATDKTVTWTSSDETVATVKDGVVTAIAAGKATITAKAGNYIATCGVTVKAKEIAISSIVLDKNEIEVTDEDDFMLTATIYPENATNKDVVWEIADEEIVINLYQNIFIAIKEGVTTITAKAGDKTATCTVTVKKADGIENSEAEDNTWPADIYDITGRMVKKNATSTDDLEKGIYLIKGKKVIIK